MAVGGLGCLVTLLVNSRQFGFSWLLGFMFYLSLALGALFLVLMHHLFDASWSVAIRRLCEHLAALCFPWLALLFVPIALLAPRIYPWMRETGTTDHFLSAKAPLFTRPMFYVVAVFCFWIWGLFTHRLRRWSLQQDADGAARCTQMMRRYSGGGVVLYPIVLTLAAIMWVKALQHQWFSTMYGVYYFAESVWVTVATVYFIALLLKSAGKLDALLQETQFYMLGSLLLAFTVFYAYIHFAQYFIIWNANLPEETYWYVLRERGSWWYVGMIIIFGHFFLPFLALLRIDVKLKFACMLPLCLWAWLMHYFDMAFNIMPVLHPNNFSFTGMWADLSCLALMGGVLLRAFVRDCGRYPLYPLKDPRLGECLGVYHAPAVASTPASAAPPLGTAGAKPKTAS